MEKTNTKQSNLITFTHKDHSASSFNVAALPPCLIASAALGCQDLMGFVVDILATSVLDQCQQPLLSSVVAAHHPPTFAVAADPDSIRSSPVDLAAPHLCLHC